jgi:hypothetical protein
MKWKKQPRSWPHIATATGADRATVAALTKILANLTTLTKAQAEELRCRGNRGHITPVPAPTSYVSATVVHGYGRQLLTRKK